MTSTIDLITQTLENTLKPEFIVVKDDRAEHVGHAHQDSGHFTVTIQSPLFTGKNAIQRHRMIYDALGSLMQTHIHALRIQAVSPDEKG